MSGLPSTDSDNRGFSAIRTRFIVTGLLLTIILASGQMVAIILSVNMVAPFVFLDRLGIVFGLIFKAGPVLALLFGSFYVWLFYYVSRLLKFLHDDDPGRNWREDEIKPLLDRCLRLPYDTALVAPIFYIVGGAYTGYLVHSAGYGGWSALLYGGLSGGLSSFFITPVLIHSFHWMSEPLIAALSASAPGLPSAARAGYRNLSARRKMIATVFTLTVAAAGFTSLVGFSRSNDMLSNLTRLENNLTTDQKMNLQSEGVKFSSDYSSRTGYMAIYLLMIVLSAVVALVVSWLSSREISNPIRLLTLAAERVGRGRYDEPVKMLGDDEFADLGMAVNRMMLTLSSHVSRMERINRQLGDGIGSIDETANSLASVSIEQAGGASQQAASVQEAASIAQEIAATAKQISQRAQEVDEVAAGALGAVQAGEGKLDDARESFIQIALQVDLIRESMHDLTDRFKAAYKIVELIAEIATQTELIALNASLEAAGAGRYGRRFEVVADATRNLALKTKNATESIHRLVKTIEESTIKASHIAEEGGEKVSAGGSAIDEVVRALETISEFAASTSQTVRDISLSTQNQTAASEQLAESVSEVRDVAMKAEESAREIEGSIQSLKEFAEALRQVAESEG